MIHPGQGYVEEEPWFWFWFAIDAFFSHFSFPPWPHFPFICNCLGYGRLLKVFIHALLPSSILSISPFLLLLVAAITLLANSGLSSPSCWCWTRQKKLICFFFHCIAACCYILLYWTNFYCKCKKLTQKMTIATSQTPQPETILWRDCIATV